MTFEKDSLNLPGFSVLRACSCGSCPCNGNKPENNTAAGMGPGQSSSEKVKRDNSPNLYSC